MVKVSVIVPVYNVEEYLDRCLKSLVKQNFEDYEVIVVNDGSPDNSQKIIDKYVKKYPDKVKGYNKKNGGVSSARNYGLKKAHGKYVAFVDSDDYVTNNYISSLYNKAVDTDSDIVVCNMYKTFDDRKENMVGKLNVNNEIVRDMMISLPACWNKLYRKSLFVDNDIYFPEIAYGEDLATVVRLIISTNKISYVNKSLYYYIQRDNSAMNQVKYNPKNSDMFKAFDVLSSYFVEKGYDVLYKEEIEYLYISHLLHDYTLRVFRYKEGQEGIKKAIKIIRDNYRNFRKNKYFKMESLKYKIVCCLIYFKKINILKLVLK